jgi:hypothetical protein
MNPEVFTFRGGDPVQIRIADIYRPTEFWVRCTANPIVAAEYGEAMKNGSEPPPVKLVEVDGIKWLVDGHLTIDGALGIGRESVMAVIEVGDRERAIKALLWANSRNPARLTCRDRNKAVVIALLNLPEDPSNTIIAELCGVCSQTVENTRKRLNIPVPETRKGKDNKTYRHKLQSALAALAVRNSAVRQSKQKTVGGKSPPVHGPANGEELQLLPGSEITLDAEQLRADAAAVKELVLQVIDQDLAALEATIAKPEHQLTLRAVARRLSLLRVAIEMPGGAARSPGTEIKAS